MTPRSRKVAVFVGTAAWRPAPASASPHPAASSRAASRTPFHAPGMMAAGGPGGGSTRTLADDLGVSETRLREAMESLARAVRGSARTTSRGRALAEELGVSEDKVRGRARERVPQAPAAAPRRRVRGQMAPPSDGRNDGASGRPDGAVGWHDVAVLRDRRTSGIEGGGIGRLPCSRWVRALHGP